MSACVLHNLDVSGCVDCIRFSGLTWSFYLHGVEPAGLRGRGGAGIVLLSNLSRYLQVLLQATRAPLRGFISNGVSSSCVICCHFVLPIYNYNMHVEGLLPANLCLVTLLSLVTSERFRCVKMVNKTYSFKTKLTGNNVEVSRVDRKTL